MKMDEKQMTEDEKWEQMTPEEQEKEADRIMEEVNRDPNLRDVEAPESVREKLFQQIREYEESKAGEHQGKIMHVGKNYKKKSKRIKLFLLFVAIQVILAIGVTSMGGPRRTIQKVKGLFGSREQIYVDNTGDRTDIIIAVNEVEAYEAIETMFNSYLPKLNYMPDGMEFVESSILETMQSATLNYSNGKEKTITYTIWFNYRTASTGIEEADAIVEEYEKEVDGNLVTVKKYEVEGSDVPRWGAEFQYQNIQYYLFMSGLDETETEQVVENLYFAY